MRVAKFLMVGLVVAGLTATASAHNMLWFDTGSTYKVSGGMGQNLVLNDGVGAESEITMWFETDGATLSWGADFKERTGTTNEITAFSISPTPYSMTFPPTIGVGPDLALGGSAVSMFDVAAGTYELATFTLKHEDVSDIYLVVNTGNFSGPGFTYPPVQFGENLPAIEGRFGVETGNVINIPEPATLALLGFGALALIRRRVLR